MATVIAISVPLFILIMFKYLGFILDNGAGATRDQGPFLVFLSIMLPAGISFYTFEIVSYSIDVADRKIEPERDPLRFMGFATFFPHLIAGPIMRYCDLRDQLRALQETPMLEPNFAIRPQAVCPSASASRCSLPTSAGCSSRKATGLPADQLMAFDKLAKIAFWSMQIYYDFWAYSIMAIGLGRLFCIELPVNFREPYLSRESARVLAAVARDAVLLAARLRLHPHGRPATPTSATS